MSFSEEILPKFPSTDVLSMFLLSEVLHRAFWHHLKKYAKHSFSLVYKYFEFFVQFFKIYKKFLNFSNFKMDLQTHRRVVSIFFEIQTYLIFMLTRLSIFQMIFFFSFSFSFCPQLIKKILMEGLNALKPSNIKFRCFFLMNFHTDWRFVWFFFFRNTNIFNFHA